MKVLIVNLILHTSEKGVIPRYASNRDCMIYNMARGFISEGHDVTLIASEEYRPTESENPGFKVIYFPSRLPGIFKPALLPWPSHLESWLRRHGGEYDAIITREVFSIGTLAVARTFPEKAVIWQEMDVYQKLFHKLPAKVWYNIITPLFMKKMRVAGASRSAVKFISKFLPLVVAEPIDHGVDGDNFFPGKEKRKQFVVVSQLIPRKRVDRTIHKFREFISLDGYENYTLEIIGDGSERGALESLCESLNITHNVNFHGRLPHDKLAEISRESLALLVDTAMDLNMVSIPEAIASGTPIITNMVPSRAEWINIEKAGIARTDWGAMELKEIADNNEKYVSNCLRLRPELLNTSTARALLDILR